MKSRHAATLALVGWYLMVPPLSPDGKDVNTSAAFSQWDARLAFDQADDCTKTLGMAMDNAIKNSPSRLDVLQWRYSRCIATDDPRLKGK